MSCQPPTAPSGGRVAALRFSLVAHSFLGLRWCVWPLTIYVCIGSSTVAAELGGQFCGWSLAVLLVDLAIWDHASRFLAGSKPLLLLQVALWVPALLLAVGTASLAPAGLGHTAGCIMAVSIALALVATSFTGKRGAPTWLYTCWCAGEAILGIAASHGLVYSFSYLLASAHPNELESRWYWLWAIALVNCALAYLSAACAGACLVALCRCARGWVSGGSEHVGIEFAMEDRQSLASSIQPLESVASDSVDHLGFRGNSGAASWSTRRFSVVMKALAFSLALAFTLWAAVFAGIFVWFSSHVSGVVYTRAAAEARPCSSCFCEPRCHETELHIEMDVKFASVFNERTGQEQALRLDIRRAPRKATGHGLVPAMVIIHGGGFWRGDKRATILTHEAVDLARKGFATFSIDYRVEGVHLIPSTGVVTDAVQDAKAAVRFVKANAAAYGVDPDRIGVWGESAGAIIAATMNYLEDPPEASFPSNVSAAVGISGCLWPFLVGAAHEGERASKQKVPWLDVHGDDDPLVPPFLASTTYHLLNVWGAPAETNRLYVVPGGTHLPWRRAPPFGGPKPMDVLRPPIAGFLSEIMNLEQLCPGAPSTDVVM